MITELCALADKLLVEDARFVATHVFKDFLTGLDVTAMDPEDIDRALSAYIVGDTGLRQDTSVTYEPGLKVLDTLDVVNSYRFMIDVTKSDYLVNFLYVPLLKACPDTILSPSTIECVDGVLTMVYETKVYSEGVRQPTDLETETICMDPIRRIQIVDRVLSHQAETVARRDLVVKEFIDAYRTRWDRALVAIEVAKGLKVA
jgi:hypothetical protein